MTATKTPWHLWLIGILALLWNGFGAFDFTASALRFEGYLANFPEAMIAWLYATPLWMWVVWGIGTWGGLIGAILLLLRNKLAVWAFALSFIGATASQIVSVIEPPPGETGAPAFLPWMIIAISVALLGYTVWLSRRGVLR